MAVLISNSRNFGGTQRLHPDFLFQVFTCVCNCVFLCVVCAAREGVAERGRERERKRKSVNCVGECHMIERAEREFCFLLQEMPKCTRFMKTEGSEKVKWRRKRVKGLFVWKENFFLIFYCLGGYCFGKKIFYRKYFTSDGVK